MKKFWDWVGATIGIIILGILAVWIYNIITDKSPSSSECPPGTHYEQDYSGANFGCLDDNKIK
jgi:hypothetical protein